jgi:hypothetical protein
MELTKKAYDDFNKRQRKEEEEYLKKIEISATKVERHTPVVMIEGVRIRTVRKMTQRDAQKQGWGDITNRVAPVIELENGIKIFPSSDEEGNNVGMLFGETKSGYNFYVFPKEKLGKVI